MTREVIPEMRDARPLMPEDRGRSEQNLFDRNAMLKELSALTAVERVASRNEIQPAAVQTRITQQFSATPLQLRQKPKDQPKAKPIIPPLPKLARGANLVTILSFLICVILPTVAAGFYYNIVATPQYVAEFRFSVKDSAVSAGGSAPGLLSAIGGGAMGPSQENYLIVDYLTSRQAVDDLQKLIGVTKLYSKPEIDALSRFDSRLPIEAFVKYWQKMILARYDQVTGIATAEIHAFSPQDALLIANTMVKLAEDLVNQISNRTKIDAVRFAEREVERAQERVLRVRLKLTAGNPDTSGARNANNANNPNNASMLLDLERQMAQHMLAGAMQTLDQARASAAAQNLYITPYIRPSLAESAIYPRPIVSTAIFAIVVFAIWLAGTLIARSIFERFH